LTERLKLLLLLEAIIPWTVCPRSYYYSDYRSAVASIPSSQDEPWANQPRQLGDLFLCLAGWRKLYGLVSCLNTDGHEVHVSFTEIHCVGLKLMFSPLSQLTKHC